MSAPFLTLLNIPVPDSIPERMIIIAEPEVGRTDPRYFNGYTGAWCHRFADWLAMHAGMPRDMIPNTSNCGSGVIWFVSNINSGGFFFKNAAHKKRMRRKYGAIRKLPEDLTTEELEYVPEVGDYIYFRWKNAKDTVTVSHVGIVLTVENGIIGTVEGNSGKKVAKRSYALGDERIVGFGHPAYRDAELAGY